MISAPRTILVALFILLVTVLFSFCGWSQNATNQKSTAAQATPAQLTPAQIIQQAKNATAMVEGEGRYGTAFCISKKGYFITNEHIVGKASSVHLLLWPGEPNQTWVRASIQRTNAQFDLALLRVPQLFAQQQPLTALEFSTEPSLSLDLPVSILGLAFSPANLTPDMTLNKNALPRVTVSTRRIMWTGSSRAKPQPLAPDDTINFDAAAPAGYAGGPVLNKNGHVVGLMIAPTGSDVKTTSAIAAIATMPVSATGVSRIRDFFMMPIIAPGLLRLTPYEMQREYNFSFKVFPAPGAKEGTVYTAEMALMTRDGKTRQFKADYEKVGELDMFSVRAVPVPLEPLPENGDALDLKLTASGGATSATFSVKDQDIQVAGRTVRLSSVRSISKTPPKVGLVSGETLNGEITGLDKVQAKVADIWVNMDFSAFRAISVTSRLDATISVDFLITVRQDGRPVAHNRGRIFAEGRGKMPRPWMKGLLYGTTMPGAAFAPIFDPFTREYSN